MEVQPYKWRDNLTPYYQNVVPRQEIWATSSRWWKCRISVSNQNFESESHFNKIPRWVVCTFHFKKHCSKNTGAGKNGGIFNWKYTRNGTMQKPFWEFKKKLSPQFLVVLLKQNLYAIKFTLNGKNQWVVANLNSHAVRTTMHTSSQKFSCLFAVHPLLCPCP